MKKRFTFIEKSFIGVIFILCFICSPLARALEFQADKGDPFTFAAPIINASNTSLFAQGANNTVFYMHGGNGSGDMAAFIVAASNISIIGTSGIYNFPLNASEMNYNRVGVLYNGTGCLEQYYVINTIPKEKMDLMSGNLNSVFADTSAMDTSTELRTLLTGTDTAVSTLTASDNIGINWADVANPTTAVNLTQTDIRHVNGNVSGTANLNGTLSY